MDIDRRRPDVMVVDGAFSDDAKAPVLGAVERAEFQEQRLGPRTGQRARSRAVLEDDAVADLLWQILREPVGAIGSWFSESPRTIFPALDRWEAVRCNPRSRLYRYGLGGDFAPHYDEAWKPRPHERSMLTVLVYLPTEGCVGGETVVDGEVVQVSDWRIAVFDHRAQHEGKPVERGEKLVLRNDVIARAQVDLT